MRMAHRGLTWSVLLFATFAARQGRAGGARFEPVPDEQSASTRTNVASCIRAHESGQELRQAGHLLQGKAQLLQCAQEICPEIVRSECVSLLDELRVQIPSVVFRITVDGQSRPDVAAALDGIPIFAEVPTLAWDIDPGRHVFVFTHGDLEPIRQEVTITEGERLVPINVQFSTPKPVPPAAPPIYVEQRPIPTAVYVLSAAGILGLGSFVGFGLAARSKEDQLHWSCSPNCSPAQVDSVETRARIADISLGIGTAALVAAGTYYLLRPTKLVQVGVSAVPGVGINSLIGVHF